MNETSAERAAGDRYLKEHGPTLRGVLLLVMADHVQPGRAYRAREYQRIWRARTGGGEPRDGVETVEAYGVGARYLAREKMRLAVRDGIWRRDGELIWHRDGPYPEGREP
jgi:hypothetical protein